MVVMMGAMLVLVFALGNGAGKFLFINTVGALCIAPWTADLLFHLYPFLS